MGITTFDRNIGIVGLAWSGKTVFLTSLLAHLQNHTPDKFPLNAQGKSGTPEIIKFTEEPVAPGVQSFPHEMFRELLVHHGEWPLKTTDTAQFRCRFQRTDWSVRDIALTFLDFPGERFADCTMLDDDFAAWSDRVLKRIEADRTYRELASDFFDLQNDGDVTEDAVIFEYKKAMGRFALNYRPLITPSIFALDQNGKQFEMMSPEEMALARITGLSWDSQFAPLLPNLRTAHPELTATFEGRYRTYRKEVPDKVFRQLAQCDRLIVLIDIPNILASNIGRLNDAEAILQNILDSCVRERGFFTKARDWMSSLTLPEAWRPRGITRIAFVATKADMISPVQIDNLLALLKEMVRKKVRDHDVRHEYFTCSAITSTYVKDGRLLGYPVYAPDLTLTKVPKPSDRLIEIRPSDLPATWPEDWQEGQFCFPEVWPSVPKRKTDPPLQSGMNRIFNYLLDEDWWE